MLRRTQSPRRRSDDLHRAQHRPASVESFAVRVAFALGSGKRDRARRRIGALGSSFRWCWHMSPWRLRDGRCRLRRGYDRRDSLASDGILLLGRRLGSRSGVRLLADVVVRVRGADSEKWKSAPGVFSALPLFSQFCDLFFSRPSKKMQGLTARWLGIPFDRRRLTAASALAAAPVDLLLGGLEHLALCCFV